MLRNAHILTATCLLFTAGSASATQKAEKIAIKPDSSRAAIVLKSRNLPVPNSNYQSAWKLNFEVYDPSQQAMQGGMLSGYEILSSKPNLFADGYLVMDLKPGTYVIRDFSRQDFWALCFHENSLQFTIRPGEILYMGEFDAVKHLTELTQYAVSRGNLRTSGRLMHYFDGVSPPTFSAVDDQGLEAAAAMVKARMPATTVAPTAVEFSPARFGTGSDAFGTNRVCGGYYNGKAKPTTSPPVSPVSVR